MAVRSVKLVEQLEHKIENELNTNLKSCKVTVDIVDRFIQLNFESNINLKLFEGKQCYRLKKFSMTNADKAFIEKNLLDVLKKITKYPYKQIQYYSIFAKTWFLELDEDEQHDEINDYDENHYDAQLDKGVG